jgi:hypothetical protein
MEEPLLEGQSETQPRRCGPCVGPGAVACVAGVALLLIVTSSAVAIGLSERDQAMPDCRKSAPVAVFTRFSHPDNAMLSGVCNEDDAFLLFGGKVVPLPYCFLSYNLTRVFESALFCQ